MSNYYFTFRSLTQAQYALVVLSKYGIKGVLVQAPMEISENGCVYAVQIKSADGYRAASVFSQEGISYIRLYHGAAWRNEVV